MLYAVKFGLNVVMLVPDAMFASFVAKSFQEPLELLLQVAFVGLPSASVQITYKLGSLAMFVEAFTGASPVNVGGVFSNPAY